MISNETPYSSALRCMSGLTRSAAIGSNINANMSNVWGSVGISNQALCNGASVSTDPVLTAINSNQVCKASDPAAQTNATINGVVGDTAIQSLSMGNSFEADSNAQNMPIQNMQFNSSIGASTVNANMTNNEHHLWRHRQQVADPALLDQLGRKRIPGFSWGK